jgi:hypothetical protein
MKDQYKLPRDINWWIEIEVTLPKIIIAKFFLEA